MALVYLVRFLMAQSLVWLAASCVIGLVLTVTAEAQLALREKRNLEL